MNAEELNNKTYEKWKAYYDLAGKHPVVADLEHNVLFALGDWIDDHNVLSSRLEAAEKCIKELGGLLREYGRHNPGCSGEFPQYKCKCGWDDISAALQPEKPLEGKP